MKLQEVVDIARYSELASIAIKDNTAAIISFVNLGMIELYTRFPIKIEEFRVDLVEGDAAYPLPSNYMYATAAYMENPEPDKYDLVPIAINEDEEELSIFFPDWNTVQVPSTISELSPYITMLYVAKPATLTIDDLDTEIYLPDTLVDALVSYIGYRAYLGLRSDGQSENNAHWLRFDRNCKIARDLGVAYQLDSMRMINRLKDRGFA